LESRAAQWREVRAELEPPLSEATAGREKAEEKVRLQRPLTPEESLAIDERARQSVDKLFDSSEVPLERAAQKGRVAAAVMSLIAILGLILGEAVALRVLEKGDGGSTESGIVESALWLGAWLVAYRLADRYIALVGDEIQAVQRRRSQLAGYVTGLVVASTYIAWHSY
jgi:hypothetical protein